MGFAAFIHHKAIDLVKLSVEMTAAAGSGHPTSAASLSHIVAVLMYHQMRYNPARPDDPRSDRLVLSEGHACPIVYAAASDLGIMIGKPPGQRHPMTWDDAMSLRAIGSPIDGHPNPAEGFPFFDAATGSLGQGLSIAAGLAAAARLDNTSKHIYCLIGDGESREGQIWEAIDFIADHRLTAVCPIFNCNKLGQADQVSNQQSAQITAAKLHAAGFDVRVIDGHSPSDIRDALQDHARHAADPAKPPLAIIARTTKGWGSPLMQGPNLHGTPMTGEKLSLVLSQLDATRHSLVPKPPDEEITPRPITATSHNPPSPATQLPSMEEAAQVYGQTNVLNKGSMATRKAYGLALQALGHANPRVVALDGDVRNSTFSEYFYKDPGLCNRFFECRIAEQNMISCAVGLAAAGKIPFASTFGKFLTRAYDQIEMALISRANIKLVGSHCGVSLAADGPSQMALSDVAFFRAFSYLKNETVHPAMCILTPSDARSAYALTIAMAAHEGACYMRTLRPDLPLLYKPGTTFPIGGHQVLSYGTDLLIIASGYMVHEVLKTLPLLQHQGIHATLVDLYSIPFDTESIADLALKCHSTVLTVEDNYGGGIGSAVADAMSARHPGIRIQQLFVRTIPKSGRSPDDLLSYLGLNSDSIAETAARLCV